MGTWQVVSMVAVDKEEAQLMMVVMEEMDGFEMRHNQGVRSSGLGDRLNIQMREQEGAIVPTRSPSAQG